MQKYSYEESVFYLAGENDPIGRQPGTWTWTLTLQGTEHGTNRTMSCTRTGTVDPAPHIKTRHDLQRQVYNFVLGGLTYLKPGAVTIFQDLQENVAVQV